MEKEDNSEIFSEIFSKSQREMFCNLILVEEDDNIFIDNTDRMRSKRCYFCGSQIRVVPYYKSGEGDWNEHYYHKECGDVPMVMVHKLHIRHTLRLLEIRLPVHTCSVCGEYGAGFLYKCAQCKRFFLDGKCAVKSFQFTRNFHPQHPVIANFEERDPFHCVVCSKSNTHTHGISYQCTTCPFRVHQGCVSSSRKYELPYHRHKLHFIFSIPENRTGEPPIYCHICQEEVEYGLHCATCKLNFHAYHCRTLDHVSHKHPLLLVEEEGCTPGGDSENCFGCGMKISVPYYACIPHYFLHKHCAHLPDEIQYYLHPGHALALRNVTESDDDDDLPESDDDEQKSPSMCNACHLPWEGFSYSCPRATCHFTVDIVCVMKATHLKYEFHPHPLITSLTKVSSACCACNTDTNGPTYQCTTCRFWVHQRCASAPRILTGNDLHPHKLKLTFSLPPAAKGKHIRCQVCRKEMQPFTWAYQCAAGCKYFTHIHICSDPNRNTEEIDPALAVHLPVANESVSLATLFFMNTTQEIVQDEDRLDTGKILYVDRYETCGECSEMLAPPCKKCVMCKYFLPKSPAELRDPSLFEGYYSMLKDSENPEENCHGFGMNFSKGISDMKISISVLPCYVKHEGHIHVLSTSFFTEPTWCNSCDEDFNGYGFRCNICDFTIDMYCALLPGHVSHGYDKVHGFKLAYYSIEGVEEYICEICEADITTSWFYHCVECDLSIHPRCIWKIRVKFGSLSNYYDNGKYKDRYYLFVVPTDKAPPIKCRMCYEVTIPCGYSLFVDQPGFLRKKFHLPCLTETERWPEERRELQNFKDKFFGTKIQNSLMHCSLYLSLN